MEHRLVNTLPITLAVTGLRCSSARFTWATTLFLLAKKHEQKLRLDYELVRALKCTEIMKAGFMFRPGSRVEVLCHDVIPIVANGKEESDRGSVQRTP